MVQPKNRPQIRQTFNLQHDSIGCSLQTSARNEIAKLNKKYKIQTSSIDRKGANGYNEDK